eukprot:Skav215800  [mRNA]  locus=scaffold3885:81612:86728:+ [translate_table: standard]
MLRHRVSELMRRWSSDIPRVKLLQLLFHGENAEPKPQKEKLPRCSADIGTSIDFSCDDCGDCGIRAEGSLSFVAGECYEIFVEADDTDEFSLSVTCSVSGNASNTTCPIYVLNADLPAQLQSLANFVTVWGTIADFEASLDSLPTDGQVLLAELDQDLQFDTLVKLNRSIREDGVVPLTPGGGFTNGPLEMILRGFPGLCTRRPSLPETVDGFYGRVDSKAWTTPYGKGRITSLRSRLDQLSDDEKQLLQSSIGAVCSGNLTNLTANATDVTAPAPINMTCGSFVNGTIVEGSTVKDAHFQRHRFCTPPEPFPSPDPTFVAEVQFSTCGSSIETGLAFEDEAQELSCFGRFCCGRDGRSTSCCSSGEERSRNMRYGECYEVNVYGSLSDLGNYTLWASCCENSFCNNRGRAEHTRWGPAMEADRSMTASDLCSCRCNFPYDGPTCSSCRSDYGRVLVNGDCEECLQTPQPNLIALHNSVFVWQPEYLRPECAFDSSSFDLSWEASDQSLVETSRTVNQSLELTLSSCTSVSRPRASDLRLTFTARVFAATASFVFSRVEDVNDLSCVPQTVCETPLPKATRPAKFVFHFLWHPAGYPPGLAAVSFLELLHNAFDGTSSTVVISNSFGNSFTNSLDSNAIMASQDFINSFAKDFQGFNDCAEASNLSLPILDPDVSVVVLIGLCFSGSLEDALEPIRSGRQILYFGRWSEYSAVDLNILVNEMNEIFEDRIPDTYNTTCDFVTSFINAAGECSKEVEDVKFEPTEVLAFQRSTLDFPGLCNIASCCVEDRCSSIVTSASLSVTCRIPLMEPGLYNVSVTFTDGEVVPAPPLRVLPPLGPPRSDESCVESCSALR